MPPAQKPQVGGDVQDLPLGPRRVTGLQGRPVADKAPTKNQALGWNGSQWVPTTISAGSTSPLTTKGDIWGYSSVDARVPVGSNGNVLTADSAQTLGIKWAAPAAGIGSTSLIYRYTVSGSAKASIDTGVDTAQAGSADWTNGDLLEVYIYARIDETVTSGQVNVTLNNDTGSNYDVLRLQAANTTVTGATAIAGAHWFFNPPGASATANVFGSARIAIPNYAGTVGFKDGEMTSTAPDETAANTIYAAWALNYRSTSAVTRLAITPNTAGKNFIIGTQLLIYKRTAS